MPGLRVETDPHDIAGIGHIRAPHYQTSLPTGPAKSHSSCKFRLVMPLSSVVRSYSLRPRGSITIQPDCSRTSTGWFKSKRAVSITAAGIRTAALLPHFPTVVFKVPPPLRIYIVSTYGIGILPSRQYVRRTGNPGMHNHSGARIMI